MASLLCTFCGDAFAADKNSPKAPICGERCDHTLCRQCVWNLQDEQAKSNWRMKILHCPLCGARGFRTNGTAPECLYTAIAMLEGNGEPRAKRARTEDLPVHPPALSSVGAAPRMETNAVASLPTTTATGTGIVNTPTAVRRNTAVAAATTTAPTAGTDLSDFRLVENDPDTQNALLLSLADLNPGTTNDGRGVPDDERDPDTQEAILQSLAIGDNNDDEEEGEEEHQQTTQVTGQENCGEGRSSSDETRASSTIEIGLPSGSQSAATGGSNLEEESSATPGTHRQSAESVGGSSLPNIQGREEDEEAAPVTMIEVAMVHSAILQAIPFHGEGSAYSPLLLDNDMELVEGNENGCWKCNDCWRQKSSRTQALGEPRKSPLGLYDQQRQLFGNHLSQGDNSNPDFNSLASSTSSAGGAPASGRSTPTSGPPKNRIAAIPSSGGKATEMADPKACIIERKDGHKGHLGSDSANCSAWWALVYGWMIGNIDELVAKQINEANGAEEEKKTKDRIYKALVILANGVSGGEKGMRSDNRNILYVPNPHDQYYDKGCNWVIFPIMQPDEMVNWAGQTYDVAIFAGETIPEVQGKGNIWKDGPSKFSAEQAEEALFNKLHLGEEIDICTTEDLKKVAKGLGEMGLALSDLHTRGSSSDFKVRILDLASAVNEYIVKEKPQQLGRNQDHDNIVNGITKLIDELGTRSFSVPLPPTKNHFGQEKKNVFKARIQQSNAPDPIALAAKGANNFYRQWGIRLLPGCHSNPTDDDSSSINVCFLLP
ncbi:expressed unknown protein [Seminavis robusta]|uniref:RING-type domain-containing protein n=1 Tax=Seminavis robusta TaxID=568900 RepID=A0A9N8H909_9STRA|nr:expressed unknown protein [Seminavis robusta]|eukprot:Sro238_g095610.1 n/a (773) ;mRNA; f:56858-59342